MSENQELSVHEETEIPTEKLLETLKSGGGFHIVISLPPDGLMGLDDALGKETEDEIPLDSVVFRATFTGEMTQNIKVKVAERKEDLDDAPEIPASASEITLSHTLHVNLWAINDGFVFVRGEKYVCLGADFGTDWPDISREFNARNRRFGFRSPLAEEKKEGLPRSRQKPMRVSPRRTAGLLSTEIRTAMSLTGRDAVVALITGSFRATEGGDAIYAQVGETQVRFECDPAIGFLPEVAIQEVAKHGPAAVQTLLTVSNLWMREKRGERYNSYMEGVTATEILRSMGRKEMAKGGYKTEDQIELGKRVWLLSNLSVPVAQITEYKGKEAKTATLSLGRLLVVDSVEHQLTLDGSMKSTVRFNFHLGKHLHEWLCKGNQWVDVSSRLLSYHPKEDKYAILFGFCLLHHEKVNRKHKKEQIKISLPALLKLAGVRIPDRNPSRAMKQWERAFSQLAADGVIPGLNLHKPSGASVSISETIAETQLLFPPSSLSLTETAEPAALLN